MSTSASNDPSPQNNPSRRAVLKSIGVTTTLAASGLLQSMIYAAPSGSANDKLRVGLIGAGNRIEPTAETKDARDRGVRLYYPEGTVVRLESDNGPAFGGIFIGEKGKLEINRGRFACNPATLLSPFEGEESENHVGNWLDCIESREEPNAPVEVGQLISSVAHLINICRITGRTLN